MQPQEEENARRVLNKLPVLALQACERVQLLLTLTCMHILHRSDDADAGSEELQEPLLGHGAERTSSSEPAGSLPGSSRAVVSHSINRLDWEELWRVLWGNCCEGFAGILGEASHSAGCHRHGNYL